MRTKLPLIVLSIIAMSGCSVSTNSNTPAPQLMQDTQPQISDSSMSTTYAKSFSLANGYSLVVAEGALEPRSIGSVNVALYRNLEVGDFVTSVSFSRSGSVLNSLLIENGPKQQKLAVTMVTAGSGDYHTRQYVCVNGEQLSLC